MIRLTELRLPLDHSPTALPTAIVQRLGIQLDDLINFTVFKRGYDARKRDAIVLVYTIDAEVRAANQLLEKFKDDVHVNLAPDTRYQFVANVQAPLAQRPIIVGFGPCGIMAGLILAQMGLRPIILERGKKVRERTKDTWGLWRRNQLNPESNVQFGEGGAGTFSDGKLYSQIKDPKHYGRKVLTEFVKAGAPEEILYLSKPHIGTFRLVKMVENIRHQIEQLGGEIRFQQQVTDLVIEAGQVRGLVLASGEQIRTDHIIMALGHSARDTFTMLHQRGVFMEAKPFSLGFRIEHPQRLIDQARFGKHAGNEKLGAADYKLVHHANNGRAVYSFCMCPGGQVVAATSEIGRVVTNGMSQYSRAERNANAGMVVAVDEKDFPRDVASFEKYLGKSYGIEKYKAGETHPLAGIVLQRQLESNAYVVGGSDYSAPGQLVGDFLAKRDSKEFGEVQPSYKPGVHLTSIDKALPAFATEAMREALPVFGRKIRGYDMADAVMTGVETRTSAPLRIGRGADFQSLNTHGLYPAGEGAGYAGGILSAGVDGIKVGEAVARQMLGLADAAE